MGISGTDLVTWASRIPATFELPALVRRLILATSTAQVSMRAGEGTRLAGFDGIVECNQPHTFIPQGASIWEMGVDSAVKGKADGDYDTRKANPLTADPTTTTFVFVTPRRWTAKETWREAKQAEGVWRDVRVLDADDLEAWLSTSPAVEGWLTPLLGKLSEGVRSAERYWADWSGVTSPAFIPEVVTAGWNDSPVEAVQNVLSGAPTALGISGESRAVSAAFLAATLVQWGDEGERQRARTLFVDDERAWTSAVDQGGPSILVPLFAQRDRAPAAVQKKHHVILPLGRRETAGRQVVKLNRQKRRDIQAALEQMPLPEEQVNGLATLGRRSLLSLRRRLAQVPAVHRPAWADLGQAGGLVAPVLAGAWYANQSGDQEVLARLADRPYSEVEREVIRFAGEDDPPLRRTGPVWLITSKEDAWQLLAPTLSEADLNRFGTVVQDVLGALDPVLDLPPEQRPLAPFLGKTKAHSDLLREELADSLALMGARSDETNWHLPQDAQAVVDAIVRRLLSVTTVQAWASMAWVFPQLAEAAPNVFLNAVERALARNQPALTELFQDNVDQLFGPSSPHTSLLWAVELLAWSPTFLPRAALVLARLAQIDPGGKLVNRPPASLREIFVAWIRNTDAAADIKLRALDGLRHHTPEVAWPLLLTLLPRDHDHSSPTHRPKWRDWGQEQDRHPPNTEVRLFLTGIVERLLEDACGCVERLLSLLSKHQQFSNADRETLLTMLETAAQQTEGQPRTKLWETLRELVARQKEFPEATWAIKGEDLDRLETLRDMVQPSDVVDRYRWLFGQTPHLGVRHEAGQHAKRHEALMQARKEALNEILLTEGTAGLQRLINELEQPGLALWVGRALGQLPSTVLEEASTLHAFVKASEAGAALVTGLMQSWLPRKGRASLEQFLMSPDVMQWTVPERLHVLHVLPADQQTWALAQQFGDEMNELYWQQLSPYAIASDPLEQVRVAFDGFRRHGRHLAAFELAELSHLSLTGDEWLELLTDLPREGSEAVQKESWHLKEVLDRLVDQPGIDMLKLAQVAWFYLPMYGYEHPPRALRQALLSDATLYADMVALAYPKAEQREALDSEGQAQRQRAMQLISSLKGIPGTDEAGHIDSALLLQWVTSARTQFRALELLDLGDSKIGKLLATAPATPDSQWPPSAVCDIVEGVESEALEEGLRIGRYNLRGMTSRHLDSGGELERDLATHYRRQAESLELRWPRTASVVRMLAQQYEAEARRHDDDSDLTQDRWT